MTLIALKKYSQIDNMSYVVFNIISSLIKYTIVNML